ncbi:hypothetical protein ACS0TY_027781 [Phlomoides rotata]
MLYLQMNECSVALYVFDEIHQFDGPAVNGNTMNIVIHCCILNRMDFRSSCKSSTSRFLFLHHHRLSRNKRSSSDGVRARVDVINSSTSGAAVPSIHLLKVCERERM